MHRLLAALVPPPRDQWISAHAAELAHIETRGQRWRWQLGLIPIFGWAVASQLLHEPRSFLESTLLRTIAGVLSFVNLIAGVTLIGIYLADTQALAMLAIGVALGAQASAALAYLRRSLARHSTPATLLLLGGSALAAATGLAASRPALSPTSTQATTIPNTAR
jgi:hypothetical protein